MMNIEKYVDKFVELAYKGAGIAIINNRPTMCVKTLCDNCDCYNKGMSCMEYISQWARSEYAEKPKLTPNERKFCELAEGGWIARNFNGDICWHSRKPCKGNKVWFSWCNSVDIVKFNSNLKFDCVTWEDEEPWSVESLLEMKCDDNE